MKNEKIVIKHKQHFEKTNGEFVKMYVNGYKNPITYKQYIALIKMLGLKRDPCMGYWYGYWPVFVFQDQRPFLVKLSVD